MSAAQSISFLGGKYHPVKTPAMSWGRVFFPLVMYAYGIITGGSMQAISLSLLVFLSLLLWLFFNRGRNFNSDDMFCFCALLFFVLAPLQSLADGVFDNGGAVSRAQYSSG